jgi:DNA-binding MarR family transcriptional regulator
MIDIADHEARHIALLYRRMLRELDRELAPLGLGSGRYPYLFALYIEDGRSQQALADAVGTDKAAAARTLARLEADGYVRRVADPRDGRALRVFLTRRGKHQRGVLERAAAHAVDALGKPLSASERAQFRALLRTLCAAPAPH